MKKLFIVSILTSILFSCSFLSEWKDQTSFQIETQRRNELIDRQIGEIKNKLEKNKEILSIEELQKITEGTGAAKFRTFDGLITGTHPINGVDGDNITAGDHATTLDAATGILYWHYFVGSGTCSTNNVPSTIYPASCATDTNKGYWKAAQSLSLHPTDDAKISFIPLTSGETIWYAGVDNDSVGNNNDSFEIGTNATPGSGLMTLDPSGNVTFDGVVHGIFPLNGALDGSIVNPVAANTMVYAYQEKAATVTDIFCVAQGTSPSITLTLQKCNDALCVSPVTIESGLLCYGSLDQDDGAIDSPAIAAGTWLKVVFGTPTGTVTGLTWVIKGTQIY